MNYKQKLTCLILFLVFTACTDYVEKLEFNGTEVYYMDSVTKAEATKLCEFLVKGEFADGSKKSVQFSRDSESNNLVFKMVTNPEVVDDPNYEYIFKTFTTEIMTEFNEVVDFYVTNNTFDTIKVYKGAEQSKSVMALKTQVRYTPNITKGQATKLANYLVEQKFANDKDSKTVEIDKKDNIYLFKMVIQKEVIENKGSEPILKLFGSLLSDNVFQKDSLRVQMCDERFNVIKDVK